MKTAKKALLIIGLIALIAPAGAMAQSAADDEYNPTLPGVGGDHNTDDLGGLAGSENGSGSGSSSGSSGSAGSSIPSGSTLRAQGPDGETAASIAEATSPRSDELQGAIDAAAGAPSTTDAASSSADESAGVSSGDSGDGSIGPALPIFVGVMLLAALAYLAKRRFDSKAEGTLPTGRTRPGTVLRSVLRRG